MRLTSHLFFLKALYIVLTIKKFTDMCLINLNGGIIFFFLVIIICIVSAIIIETYEHKEEVKKQKKEYNNCVCSKCTTKLKHVKTIEGGKRVYICPNCYNVVMISHAEIDMDPETGLFSYEGKNKNSEIEEGN